MKATRVNSGDKKVTLGVKQVRASVANKTAARRVRP